MDVEPTRSKSNAALSRVDLHIAHGIIAIRVDDVVHHLDLARKAVVKHFPFELQLQKPLIQLVDGQHRFDALAQCLSAN